MQAIETVEGTSPHTALPWSGRTGREWVRLVEKDEAVSLFLPAAGDDSHIRRWELAVPFQVYWGSDTCALLEDIQEVEKKNDRLAQLPKQQLEYLAKTCLQIFEEPKLWPYLLHTRLALKEHHRQNAIRQKSLAHIRQVKLDLYQEAVASLGWDMDTVKYVHLGYQALVELFLGQAEKIAQKRATHYRGDVAEWTAFAYERLAHRVRYFYWESVIVDHGWTVRRFISSFTKSVFPTNSRTDASLLAVGGLEIDKYKSGQETEQMALNRLTESDLQQQIVQATTSEVEEEVVKMRVFGGYNYQGIAQATGVSAIEAERMVTEAARKIFIEESSRQKPEETEKPSSYNLVFSNLTGYRRLFDDAGRRKLKPYCYRAVEQFFAVVDEMIESGQKPEQLQKHPVVEAVGKRLAAMGNSSNKTTVDRQLRVAFAQLADRSAYEYPQAFIKKDGRLKMAETASHLKQHPEFWSTLSPRTREIARMYYLHEGTKPPTKQQIAQQLGIHPCTVIHHLNKFQIMVVEFYKRSDILPQQATY